MYEFVNSCNIFVVHPCMFIIAPYVFFSSKQLIDNK